MRNLEINEIDLIFGSGNNMLTIGIVYILIPLLAYNYFTTKRLDDSYKEEGKSVATNSTAVNML